MKKQKFKSIFSFVILSLPLFSPLSTQRMQRGSQFYHLIATAIQFWSLIPSSQKFKNIQYRTTQFLLLMRFVQKHHLILAKYWICYHWKGCFLWVRGICLNWIDIYLSCRGWTCDGCSRRRSTSWERTPSTPTPPPIINSLKLYLLLLIPKLLILRKLIVVDFSMAADTHGSSPKGLLCNAGAGAAAGKYLLSRFLLLLFL